MAWNLSRLSYLLVYSLLFIGGLTSALSGDVAPLELDEHVNTLGDGYGVQSSTFQKWISPNDGKDLNGLNNLLKNVILYFPDFKHIDAGKHLLGHLFVNVEQMTCQNLHVSRIQLFSQDQSNDSKSVDFDFIMGGVDLDCQFQWHYQIGFKHGSGHATLTTKNNGVSSGLSFTPKQDPQKSIPFTQYNVTKDHCNAKFKIDDLSFKGGAFNFEGDIVSLFKNTVENTVSDAVQKLICEQLQKNEVIQGFANKIEKILYNFTVPVNKDALAPEKKIKHTPVASTLINLKDLSKYPFGEWIEKAVDKFRKYANTTVNDGENGDTLGINRILRSHVLHHDADGYYLRIPVSEMTNGSIYEGDDLFNTTTRVTLDNVYVHGLDSFTVASPLFVPVGNFTIQNSLALKNLTARMDFTVLMTPPNNPQQTEKISITWGVEDFTFDMYVMMAMYQDKWSGLKLGSLLEIDRLTDCLSSLFHSFEITSLDATIKEVNHIQEPKLTGFVSRSLDQALTNSTQFLLNLYKNDLHVALPNIFNDHIRKILNRKLTEKHNETKSLCPVSPLEKPFSIEDKKEEKYLNFFDLLLPKEEAKMKGGDGTSPYGDLFSTIKNELQKAINEPATNPLSAVRFINDMIIGPLTKFQSKNPGDLIFPGILWNLSTNVSIAGLEGNIDIKLSDLKLLHLNTVGEPLKLIDPLEKNVVSTSTTFGVGDTLDQNIKLQASLFVRIGGDDKGKALEDNINISLHISSISLFLSSLMKVSRESFLNLELANFLDGNCWLSTIPAPSLDKYGVAQNNDKDYPFAQIKDLALTFDSVKLNVDCLSCSSKGFEELSNNLKTNDGQNSFSNLFGKTVSNTMAKLDGKFSQVVIDRALNDAKKSCGVKGANHTVYETFDVPTPQAPYPSVLIGIICILISILLMTFLIRKHLVRSLRQRRQNWVQMASNEEITRRIQQHHREKSHDALLNHSTQSMCRTSVIPFHVRVAVPFIIIGNIIFFLTGHLSLGASVAIRAGLGGQSVAIDHFFEFSMFKSAVQMWQSGAKILSVLTFAFSGVWPYSKQLLTFVLWFSPPNYVSVKKRGAIFDWLDLYSKWSLVDIFVTMMSVIGFRLAIESPEIRFLPSNFYHLDLLVIPRWGIYANLLAIVISQVTSHFMVFYHRKIVESASPSREISCSFEGEQAKENSFENVESDPLQETTGFLDNPICTQPLIPDQDVNESLCDHVFVYEGVRKLQYFKIKRIHNLSIKILGFAVLLLHIVGCCVPIFELQPVGLVGVAVSAGHNFEREVKKFSLFAMAKALFQQSMYFRTISSFLGMLGLAVILLVAIAMLPTQVHLLLRRWFEPLSSHQRKRLDFVIEMMHAWQLVEVFLFSIIVTAWQLGPVSEFFLNDYCGSLEDIFKALTFFDILDNQDAQCFKTQAELTKYTWFLFFASVTFALFNHIITSAGTQQKKDILFKSRNWENNFNEDGDSFIVEDEFIDDDLIGEYRSKVEDSVTSSHLNFAEWYKFLLCVEECPSTTYELIDQEVQTEMNPES